MDQSTSPAQGCADTRFANWLSTFGAAVERGDAAAFAAAFTTEGYWRDILAFTWEHRTFSGVDEIGAAFGATAGHTAMRNLHPAYVKILLCQHLK